MIKIHFGRLEEQIISIGSFFNFEYEKEWNRDKMVQDILADIDKCVYLGEQFEEFYKHDTLGIRRITQMSGGSKNLILMLKKPIFVFRGSSCGENCIPWIERIGSIVDFVMTLEHCMILDPENVKGGILCLNDNEMIKDKEDFLYRFCKFM